VGGHKGGLGGGPSLYVKKGPGTLWCHPNIRQPSFFGLALFSIQQTDLTSFSEDGRGVNC
jgi:hypothetical protein